ncbi:DNA methyltransferase [Lentilactobacillus otakiensis]|uniref:DNA methyltransferase n=1 Tax=Lentilactobacillus otakiensis TaxID=481720 RepID=UPI003D167C84
MQVAEQKKAAKKFSEDWKDQGYEKGQSQAFWIALLSDVLGVKGATQYIEFEDEVHLDKTSFIDGYIPKTHVLIEQKGINKDLNKGIHQSDGSFLTPFQQAKRYSANLPYSKRPRWIVTCNFKEFNIYDMEKPVGEPIKLMLADLPKQYYLLDFLVDQTNVEIKKETNVSVKAGDLVGKIYDELKKQYKDPDNEHSQRSINQLCVRFVFCLYAEDAGIFGKKDMFHDYLKDIEPRFLRRSIIDLFKVLDTKIQDRDPYLDDQLAQFPYVNGGLFSEEDIEIPNFTPELKGLLLNDASADFDWSDISPTIFGAVFESTLNPDTRREGGMHYTSIENIHKVIDPLFLDDLKEELLQIKQYKQPATLREKAKQFQFKLSKLTFFDPACGSGNFLTETYLSLRKLENEAIKLAFGDQGMLDVGQDLIKVSIQQFYGIEINDFAVSVAKTALWIAESQMMEATKAIVYANMDFLPLKTYTKIVEGNALQIDWQAVVPNYKLDYIVSNPPFIGYTQQSASQKNDLALFAGKPKNIDYVAGWYFKAAKYIHNTTIEVAYVSTNSISQGEQAALIWKPLFDGGIHINFAYSTFKWNSEATQMAHVHVVIIGFSEFDRKTKKIYSNNNFKVVSNINGYLTDADNIFVTRRTTPIDNVPQLYRGSQPTDGGNFILTSKEKNQIISQTPEIAQYIRPFMMGKDFIVRKPRYCLWLVGANPSILRKSPIVMKRIRNVEKFRLKSKKAATRRKAGNPTLFDEIHDSKTDYIAIPVVSSQARKYIPIDYLSWHIIAGNKIFMMPNASPYSFGVLTSNVHMAWMRAVGGRLKSDYSYSNTIVYNNFPWPSPTHEQKELISSTAQQILDARASYPNSSFADLYDDLAMPPELRKAHQENDKAVMQAYGMSIKNTTESDAVRELFKLYSKLTKLEQK